MGKMISVALVNGLSDAPSKRNDPNQVQERDGQNKQGDQHRPSTRMMRRVEVRQNRQDGQQVTEQMTACVA